MPRLIRQLVILAAVMVCSQANALQDPTKPTDASAYFGDSAIQPGGWALQSILSSPKRRIAIINGTSVREGDRIGAARVIHIRDTQVILQTGGRDLTLHLLPETIKVSP